MKPRALTLGTAVMLLAASFAHPQSQAPAKGLTRVPVVFGVLTVNTVEQALERSRADETNKGREAALTALEMVSVLRQGSLGA